MGDSDTVQYGVLLAMILVPGSIAAFMLACCVRDRGLRVAFGILLLVAGAFCGIASAVWALFFATLGVAVLFLASKTVQRAS